MGILRVGLNNINLDDVNCDDDPESIIHIRLMAWRDRYKQRKAIKKRVKLRINASSMASNKIMALLFAKR